MSTVVEAELYVLRRSEGGQLAELRSGCDAILHSEGLETAVSLQLYERETLQPGESGTASLTLLQPETDQAELTIGETFALTIDGDKAAVGQILGDDSTEQAKEIVFSPSDADDDPPRIVVLVSILLGGLFVLLFARNIGALWQRLVGLAISVAAVVSWSVYSELKTTHDAQCCDEPADARESRS
jgi:hypothetical protein